MLQDTRLYIDGRWRPGSGGRTIDVVDPAIGRTVGRVAHADLDDLDEAVAAAVRGFRAWRGTSALDRGRVLRRAADLLRERVDAIASTMTSEQGKPLAESRAELLVSADILDWCAEEGRRTYGRLIPARFPGVTQAVTREPVGPVAAFTPWNFPVSQVVRKVAAALAVGCSMVVKAPEETPASPAELVRALADAGLPPGVLNLVYGSPAQISGHLIPHPAIRKVSFTGSVPVGKGLAALAGAHMKRATMELGGHAPAMVFADADLDAASAALATAKFRNAGQVCVSPTRFLVQEDVLDAFTQRFVEHARSIRVGDGRDPEVRMGPVVSGRRRDAVEALVAEAVQAGAEVATGGRRVGNEGFFHEPTVLTRVDRGMRVMNEEPFGPVAMIMSFRDLNEVVAEANRLPYGLAAYAFSRSARTVAALSEAVETGMMTVNHLGLALPETPFGGVKDSGYGSEGGPEALEAYLNTKFVTHLAT